MKALFISFDGLTDPLGQSQVLPYLCGLSQLGHQIHILSLEKPSKFAESENKIRQIIHANNLKWTPLVYNDAGLKSKFKNVKKIRQAALSIVQNENIELVHCRSYLSALVGEYLKRNKQIKFLFDMRGFWADERIDGGIWQKNKPVHWLMYRYFKKKEKTFLKNADKIVSLTHHAKNEMISWSMGDKLKDKIHVIPCCVDLDFFDPAKVIEEENDLKDKIGIPGDKKVLLYIGSLGTWYLLPEMIHFFTVLQNKTGDNWHFLIVTTDDKNLVWNEINHRNLSRNFFTVVSAKREEVPAVISLADASVFFIKQAYSKIASSPTKLAELLAMNVPVITNSGIGDNDYLNEKFHYGVLLNEFSETEYLNAIQFLKNVNTLKLRPFAEEYFSLEKGILNYHHIYQELQSQ